MAYSDEIVQRVWEKARGMPDRDPNEWRQDECGAWIHREQYGSDSETAEFAWKIENVTPGNPGDLEDLRPFHRDNGFDRAQRMPRCHVTADREHVGATASIGVPRNRTTD